MHKLDATISFGENDSFGFRLGTIFGLTAEDELEGAACRLRSLWIWQSLRNNKSCDCKTFVNFHYLCRRIDMISHMSKTKLKIYIAGLPTEQVGEIRLQVYKAKDELADITLNN